MHTVISLDNVTHKPRKSILIYIYYNKSFYILIIHKHKATNKAGSMNVIYQFIDMSITLNRQTTYNYLTIKHVFLFTFYSTVSFVQVLGPLTSEYLLEPPLRVVTAPLMNNSLNVSLNCLDIPQ